MVPLPPKWELTEGEQGEVIGIRKGGISFAAIGQELCVNDETVQKV
jgi:hypothetical protein